MKSIDELNIDECRILLRTVGNILDGGDADSGDWTPDTVQEIADAYMDAGIAHAPDGLFSLISPADVTWVVAVAPTGREIRGVFRLDQHPEGWIASEPMTQQEAIKAVTS
jgi:hypothetical protein